MIKRKKSKINDDLLKNLKGFASAGALFKSPGNIPTGHFALDFAIQYGMNPAKVDLSKIDGYDPSETLGLPLGKLVEIFGEEGSGKSSLAYRAVGYAQQMGYPVAWIDTEHSFSQNLAKINGCDVNNIIYSNLVNTNDPDKDFHAEDVIDNICKMCEGGVKVIVLDSVANLTPKARNEADAEQKFMGLLSRLLSENLGKVVSYAEKYGTLLIFINQLRENLRITWGDPETSPGGHSLKHNASLRLKMKKKFGKDADIIIHDDETGGDKLIGRNAGVAIVKSRLAKPFREVLQVPIYYEAYFPDIEEISFDTGRQVRLISVRQEVFKWNDLKIHGRREFINYIRDNNLIDELVEAVRAKAVEKDVLLPPELVQYECKFKSKKKGAKNVVGGEVQGSRSKKDNTSSEEESSK